jgi:hypothetical protein
MPAAQKYFIQEPMNREVFHGSICKIDAENILLRQGYKAIEFPGTFDFSIRSKWKRLRYLIRLFFSIRRKDLVVFLPPLCAKISRLLLTLLSIKGVQTVCFIIDIEGLRDGDKKLLQKEKKAFRLFRHFIVHNEGMRQWLQAIVPNATMVQLQFWDFLTAPAPHRPRIKDAHVVFAGNLEKSSFIYKLGQLTAPCPQLTFSIYGPGRSEKNKLPGNAVYKGVFPPYELVKHVQGSFGLVWDGPEIDSCTGNYGNYLALNSPHKLSLYILAGIPLIVPVTSASAALVKQYGIGCTIEQLPDLEEVIKKISAPEYQAMIDNMQPLARQLSQGRFLTTALDRLEQTLYES